MKKITPATLAIALAALLTGCKEKKTEEGDIELTTTQTTVKSDSAMKSERQAELYSSITGADKTSKTFPYRAMDGSGAKVTFNNGKDGQPLTVEANGKKFELDKRGDGAYGRNGIDAQIKGDSLLIRQDDNEIPLVFVK